MAEFYIQGGERLSGEVIASGNKNAALPLLAATLLTSQPITLHNVPRIRDVLMMIELLQTLGATVRWTAPNSLVVDASLVSACDIDPRRSREMRASILT